MQLDASSRGLCAVLSYLSCGFVPLLWPHSVGDAVKLILVTYCTSPNTPNVLLFQTVINVKIINELFPIGLTDKGLPPARTSPFPAASALALGWLPAKGFAGLARALHTLCALRPVLRRDLPVTHAARRASPPHPSKTTFQVLFSCSPRFLSYDSCRISSGPKCFRFFLNGLGRKDK